MICIAYMVFNIGCESSPTRTNENPEPGVITMVTTADVVYLGLYGKGPVEIDWGNEYGTRSTLREWHFHYQSEFRSIGPLGGEGHTITIKGHVTHLHTRYNRLTELDVRLMPSLEEILCEFNFLSELDVSRNTRLRYLLCDGNQLTHLDVSRNTLLVALTCGRNLLTELDVSRNTSLFALYADGNQLSSLDLSRNIRLEGLLINNNRLTHLNVSRLSQLRGLMVDNNYLNTLDMSDNPNITFINADRNLFCKDELDRLFDSLPDLTDHFVNGLIWIVDNPGTDESNKNIAENKNWRVLYDYSTLSETNKNELMKENIFLWRKK